MRKGLSLAVFKTKRTIQKILWYVNEDTPKEYIKTAKGMLIGYRIAYSKLLHSLVNHIGPSEIEPSLGHLIRDSKLVIRPSGGGRCFIVSKEILHGK